jgi:membrane-bound ClpP family serine protease
MALAALAAFGCVAVACVTAAVSFRWALASRERLAALKARDVDEGLKSLPAHVVELERRVKQLEARGVMGR